MASWLRDGKQPPQVVLEIIERYLHRVARPMYLGAISLYVGWSLARTQEMLETMQERGLVVPLDANGLKAHGFRDEDIVWHLVAKPTPAKAHW